MTEPSREVICQPQGTPPQPSKSFAVKTRITPGMASAASTSMPFSRPWATSERTKTACAWPCRLMSSVYCPVPLRNRASSRRFGLAPMPPSFGMSVLPGGDFSSKNRA